MPKPYFIARPSGLYVRYRVPADLRTCLNRRFIVRPIGPYRGDLARLFAARLAVALSQLFQELREGVGVVDPKKLIESAQEAARRGATSDWTATNVRIGGVSFGNVSTTGKEDTEAFIRTMQAAAELAVPEAGPAAPSARRGGLLSVEIGAHLADLERAKLGRETITESKLTLRILLGVIGDMPVDEIDRDHIRAFWDGVKFWPPYATTSPRYRGLSVLEIIEIGRREQAAVLSDSVFEKHRQRLAVFFNALIDAKAITSAPHKGVRPPINKGSSMETGRPFTDEELSLIFGPQFSSWAAKAPHRWWGPILGAYSGARLTEVAQLYLDDITQEAGVWGMHINNRFPGQKIKTKSSRRFVPLAQRVLDAGFLDFVEDMRATGHPRLFPHLPAGTAEDGKPNGLGYGRQLSRQFGAYLTKLGVEKGVAFHAFRHTVATRLDRAGVPLREIGALTGHAVPGTVLVKHYINPHTIPERLATVNRLSYPFDLPAYQPGQFSKSMASRADLHP